MANTKINLVKIIKEIDVKYLNEKMNFHDDFMLYFLLTRRAYNYKRINRLFYIILKGWNKNNKKVEFRIKEKIRNMEYMRCNSLLNFIEFSLNKTENRLVKLIFILKINEYIFNIYYKCNSNYFSM